jgi:hypothetical protein
MGSMKWIGLVQDRDEPSISIKCGELLD